MVRLQVPRHLLPCDQDVQQQEEVEEGNAARGAREVEGPGVAVFAAAAASALSLASSPRRPKPTSNPLPPSLSQPISLSIFRSPPSSTESACNVSQTKSPQHLSQ